MKPYKTKRILRWVVFMKAEHDKPPWVYKGL